MNKTLKMAGLCLCILSLKQVHSKYIDVLDAAAKGDLIALQTIIDEGKSITKCGSHMHTALHIAACENQLAAVKFLLDHHVPLEARNKDGETALHLAAFVGHTEIAAELIVHGAFIEAKDNDGQTPLLLAALNGQLGAVKLLVDNGALVNTLNKYGNTPLYVAVLARAYDVADFLLAHAATIDIKNNTGLDALCIATILGLNNIAYLLLEHSAPMHPENCYAYPVHVAAKTGNTPLVKIFIQFGENINIQDLYGWTPLHYATVAEQADLISYLLENGASPEIRTFFLYRTPRYYAQKAKNPSVLKLFEEHDKKKSSTNL